MKNTYDIVVKKHSDDISTLVMLTWVYGKPNENLSIEQVFEGDSITFKELKALISALDEAVKHKEDYINEL